MIPFSYPEKPHERRHGPLGYAQAASYRPWLRDEFDFRCVYCLDREQWQKHIGKFAVEHFLPVSKYPSQELDYDNLVYACVSCNLTKAQGEVADPTGTLLNDSIVIHGDGRMEGRTKEAARLIDKLLLDSEECRIFRRRWINIIRLAKMHARDLYQELLGYPLDMPNLARLRPSAGNKRPEGIRESHYARQKRGELPATY